MKIVGYIVVGVDGPMCLHARSGPGLFWGPRATVFKSRRAARYAITKTENHQTLGSCAAKWMKMKIVPLEAAE
jgi:hypothetical protein